MESILLNKQNGIATISLNRPKSYNSFTREMALACQHAFIPGVSSTSMADMIAKNPDHFSQTGEGHHDNIEGTIATEKALSLILARISK